MYTGWSSQLYAGSGDPVVAQRKSRLGVVTKSLPSRRRQTKRVSSRGNSLESSYHQLRELIVRGRVAPGSRLIEAELAARLGVSRTPVRGALNWLQREGYVVVISGHDHKSRLAVAPLTKDDARELYWIVGH